MAIGLTQRQLQRLSPCEESYEEVMRQLTAKQKWGNRQVTATDAVKAGVGIYHLSWVAVRLRNESKAVSLLLSKFFADCATHALPHYEARVGYSDVARKAITRLRTLDPVSVEKSGDSLWKIPEVQEINARLKKCRKSLSAKSEDREAYLRELRNTLIDHCPARGAESIAQSCPDLEKELAWQRDRFAAWFSDAPPKPLRFPPRPKPKAAKKAAAKPKAKTRNR